MNDHLMIIKDSATKVPGNNFVFSGLPGVGKTFLAQAFANYAGLGFIDTDSYISQKTRKPIHILFREFGEDGFRDMENKLLEGIDGIKNHVISLGGGTLQNNKNLEIVNKNCHHIWLNPDLSTLVDRYLNNTDMIKSRPVFKDLYNITDKQELKTALTDKLNRLLVERSPGYSSAMFEYQGVVNEVERFRVLLAKIMNEKIKTSLPENNRSISFGNY